MVTLEDTSYNDLTPMNEARTDFLYYVMRLKILILLCNGAYLAAPPDSGMVLVFVGVFVFIMVRLL